jgi:amino-acid N-acetyltransferase
MRTCSRTQGQIPPQVHAPCLNSAVESISGQPSRQSVIALLSRAQLPTSDITDELLESFFFAGQRTNPLGIVGLELSPPHALLRSLVVKAEARSGGLGSRLLEHAEERARARGVHRIYLLTTTGASFFAARGYEGVARRDAPPFIRSSAEFASLCPASSAFMVKHLQE